MSVRVGMSPFVGLYGQKGPEQVPGWEEVRRKGALKRLPLPAGRKPLGPEFLWYKKGPEGLWDSWAGLDLLFIH